MVHKNKVRIFRKQDEIDRFVMKNPDFEPQQIAGIGNFIGVLFKDVRRKGDD